MKDKTGKSIKDKTGLKRVSIPGQKSNLRFLDRIRDSWYRILERGYGGNDYYIGQDIASLLLKMKGSKVPSQLVSVSEERSKTFGVNQSMSLSCGLIFGDAVQTRKFLWANLYFFRPINIEGTPIKLALARRCFIENDTIVLDGSMRYFYLNLPSHMAAVLRALVFTIEYGSGISSNVSEVVGCHISDSCVQKIEGIVCVRTDNEDGMSNLSITCDRDNFEKILPTISEVVRGEGNEEDEVKHKSIKRSACGYNLTRGETTGFTDTTHKTFALAEGHSSVLMPTEEAKNLERALKALSYSSCLVPIGSTLLDELYVGGNAIYQRWHRGWTNFLR